MVGNNVSLERPSGFGTRSKLLDNDTEAAMAAIENAIQARAARDTVKSWESINKALAILAS